MGKVFKDHFGRATSEFDRINKFNKNKREKPLHEYSLADQIRMVEEMQEAERKEKAATDKIAASEKKIKDNEVQFSNKFLTDKAEAEIAKTKAEEKAITKAEKRAAKESKEADPGNQTEVE